jgi:hypothetical protein
LENARKKGLEEEHVGPGGGKLYQVFSKRLDKKKKKKKKW